MHVTFEKSLSPHFPTDQAASSQRRLFPRRAQKALCGAFLILVAFLSSACYSLRWTAASQEVPPPETVAKIFDAEGGVLKVELLDPNDEYPFDPAEKDELHAEHPELLRFRRAEIRLHDRMPPGTVLVDMTFYDDAGSVVRLDAVDLLRIVPRIDTQGELQYPELLLEEFTRYAVSFRREHREFSFEVTDPRANEAVERTYRAVLSNNCLDPAKWEIALVTEDYSDFSKRLHGPININQNRVLAHSWFFLDRDLYTTLIRVKNPGLIVDPEMLYDYDGLGERSEEVVVDLDQLRTVKKLEETELLEIGYASGRSIEALDTEQFFKWDYGLFVNQKEYSTYRDLLEGTVQLATYGEEGFYDPEHPKHFKYDWLVQLDKVEVRSIELERAGTFIEITLDGELSPYMFKLGNLDLARLDEQRLFQQAFGFNIYPTSRRHTPTQSTIRFDQDLMPDDIKPYLVMIDKETGRFVNHQVLGFDRIYVGWESLDRDVLEIYLISYERIIPVWMARCGLNDELVDRARVRRSFFG